MRRILPPASVAFGLVFSMLTTTAAFGGIRQQLNATLPEIPLNGVPFTDAIDFLRDVSGANITVNWKALEEVGINKDVPINVRLRSVSLRKALQLVISEAGGGDKLTYDLDQNVIEVTTRELADARMFTKVYPIQDLIMEIPDFVDAPDISLNTTSNNTAQNPGSAGGAGGGGGGSTSPFSGTTSGEKKVTTREERARNWLP